MPDPAPPSLFAPLWSTPAWRHASQQALDRERDLIARIGDLEPPARAEPMVRFAELLSAAGLAQHAWSVLDAVDPAALSTEIRGRWVFARHRLLARLPGHEVMVLPSPDDTPLGRRRAAILRAEQATLSGQHDEALTAWEEALGVEVEGLTADELGYEAAVGACRLALPRDRVDKAISYGRQAVALARRYGADGDEAVAIGALYAAHAARSDRDALLDLGRRAAELPTGLPGALPPGYVSRLTAANAVMGGDAATALRTLDQGLRDAYERRDPHAYASLVLAKWSVFHGLGDDWLEYRTLRLGQHTIRSLDAEVAAALLQPAVERLHRRLGEPRWEELGARLIAELRA